MSQSINKSKKKYLLQIVLIALSLSTVTIANGRAQGAPVPQTPKANQVQQLSGRTQGGASASITQSGTGSTSSSVNTVNSTVSVQGNYAGSINAPLAGTGPVALTFAEAIQMGLKYNLGTVASDATSRQLRAQRLNALSNLLPNIYATLAESAAKSDLQTQGITSSTFGGGNSGSGGGISVPNIVGPYHYYSLEGNLTEQLSFTDMHNLKSANAARSAAVLNMRDARELVVVAVGGSYLKVLASVALVESQEVQVEYAQSSYKQTAAQFQAGTKAEIDANKSLVELQTEQQRLTSQQGDLIKQKMQLARIIGISPGKDLQLAEKLSTDVPVVNDVDASIGFALSHRADLQASGKQLAAAEEAYRASKSEYLPSFAVSGYYGLQGVNPNKGNGVFSASATLTVPIFNSGKTKGDVQQADAAVKQRKAEDTDQRGIVEDDVRSALVDLRVASQQLQVAESNRTLAKSTLQQSIDRYAAGVADAVEVVQSQETLASAEHDYISSLYSLNLSKISVARAMGNAEQTIPDMMKGK